MIGPRATVRLLLDCDNACVFCGQAGLTSPAIDEATFSRALEDARATTDTVTFVGGEPLLDPSIVERVAAARSMGFRRVGVQTNGRRLASTDLVAALARAGLTDAHLSIHGAEPAVHDYHTGVDGSLRASLAGVAALRANGVTVVVTTILTRSNFRNLAPLARLLSSRGVAAWLVAVPRVAGRAAIDFDRVVPRLGLAVPFALHAMEAARALGLPAWIRGAPLCVLGPFAKHALREADEGAARARSFAAPCEACAARSQCDGLEPEYLERFGDGELCARDACEPTADEAIADVADGAASELRALFVGPGSLVRAPEGRRPLEPPPERARASLPILGKVRPARAEASPASERKTGEALREIFPGLYEPPPKRE